MFLKEIFCILVTSLYNVPAVQGGDWGVHYPPQEMCALRGSSVVIPCTYDYPESFKGTVLTVVTVKWFGITDRDRYVYDSTGINVSPEYENRTEYLGNKVKNCTLQIRDLQSTDAGRYYFRFETNQPDGKWTGASGVSLSVIVHEEPKVTLDPPVPDHTVKEGSFVSLTCGFDRCTLSESSFVWYREGQPISNEKSNKLQFNVSYEHSGKYCCAAAEKSRIKSEEINLIVKYSPKNTSASVRAPGGIAEGSSVTLTCTSNANPPVSSYTWFRRDGNGDEEKAHQQHLNFSSITSSNSGDYYCEAKNSLGAQNSSSVHLSVTDSPKNTSASVRAPGGIVEGSSVTLTCTSNANPPVSSYTWFRRDGNGDEEKARQQHLNFSSITSSNSGDYYCEAQNSLGAQNSSSVHLSVTGRITNEGMKTILAIVAASIAFGILMLGIIVFIKRRNKPSIEESFNNAESQDRTDNISNIVGDSNLQGPAGEDDIQYAAIHFQPKSPERNKHQEEEEDASVIYSTVAKPANKT
ncbi:B-cell receptor CD22-like [Acipenser ruthenus]|uniref:B-cell receptor CD22-like n=1 Tax=Acipenser ruthenus TaxID=7906 RepID=UPI0027408238|nr:B-cell receptor CD22-like [Acipenser ruthenus]